MASATKGAAVHRPGLLAPLSRARSFMPRFPRPDRRIRSAALTAILAFTFALAALLAYEAYTAERSHRRVAERALRDYAAVVAWDYSLNVKDRFYKVLTVSFAPIVEWDVGRSARVLPPPTVLERPVGEAARCESERQNQSRYFFRVDLDTNRLLTSGGPVPGPVGQWIVEAVAGHAADAPGGSWIYAHAHDVVAGLPQSIAYVLVRGPDGEMRAAYGYATCMSAWGKNVFAAVMHDASLLPPVLTGGLPNDSLFSVVVTDERNRVLWASPHQYAQGLGASFTLGADYGGMTTYVNLNPAAAERLVIGGLPRSRLPFLAALLLLTALLLLGAVHLLRRHSQLARIRSDFISSVSHELRTPLAQIRMFTETLMLGRVRSEGEQRRALEIIDQESRRLSHLVANILQFSRSERRSTQLHLERIRLADEVRETVEAFAPLAEARRVDIVLHLEHQVTAPVDRFALRQMLLNLLDNAVKYGPPDQRVTVCLEQRGDRARLSVTDQGPGIAPRDQGRIWEPFYRREGDSGSAVAGSGIGLSVVRDLVKVHDGVVWVEKARDEGARFVIELPGARAASPPVEAQKPVEAEEGVA